MSDQLIAAAKCVIRDADGYVLAQRRSGTHPHVPYTYDLPGGKVEPGETTVQGLAREVFEETGITAEPSAFRACGHEVLTDYFGADYDLYLYEYQLDSRPAITLSSEHDAYDWVLLAELDVLENPAYMRMIAAYKQAMSATDGA